jgi:hypothetical protein
MACVSGTPQGVCFGHQLIAQALGGRVTRAPGWGIGAKVMNFEPGGFWPPSPLSTADLKATCRDDLRADARVLLLLLPAATAAMLQTHGAMYKYQAQLTVLLSQGLRRSCTHPTCLTARSSTCPTETRYWLQPHSCAASQIGRHVHPTATLGAIGARSP